MRNNAKEKAQVFYAKHFVNGIAEYADGERILVTTDVIRDMCPTFVGCPVYVLHQDVEQELVEELADGYVIECFYNESDGWFWAKMIVKSDEGLKAVRDGWSVSNSYFPEFLEESGKYLNVDYSKKVIGGNFDHLAIVPNPRYEESVILTPSEFKEYNSKMKNELESIKNSKEEKKGALSMFTLFKKKEVSNLDDLSDAFVKLSNGTEMSLADMVQAIENEAKEEDKAEEEKAENSEDMMAKKLTVGNSEMTVKELMDAYENMLSEKAKAENEAEEEAKAKEEAKQNALEEAEAEKEAEKEAKEGEKHLKEMKNAISNAKQEPMEMPQTQSEKVAEGKNKY